MGLEVLSTPLASNDSPSTEAKQRVIIWYVHLGYVKAPMHVHQLSQETRLDWNALRTLTGHNRNRCAKSENVKIYFSHTFFGFTKVKQRIINKYETFSLGNVVFGSTIVPRLTPGLRSFHPRDRWKSVK